MDKLLSEIRSFATINNVPVMLDESISILRNTLKRYNPKRILEIGTAIGYSGIVILNECKDAILYTIDVDEERLNIAKENFHKAGMDKRVTFWQGDANEIVRFLTGEFDFILLDGPKGHYAEILPYLNDVLVSGGVIFADNVLFKGYTDAETVGHKHRTIVNSLSKYVKTLTEGEKYNSKLLEAGDGILISVKK